MRIELGFARTTCGCEKCSVFCEHLPGALVPTDLDRLIPPGDDPFTWAEQHIRASRGSMRLTPDGVDWVPSLVPAKAPSGHCHWLAQGRCMVHADSPFGCAFLDQHMTDKVARRRAAAGREARRDDFESDGLYARIWRHLSEKGLTYLTSDNDWTAVKSAMQELLWREKTVEQRHQRDRARKQRRKERRMKKASKR